MRWGMIALVALVVAGAIACTPGAPEPATLESRASPPANWVSIAPPVEGSTAASCANWARDRWTAALTSDSSQVRFSEGSPDAGADTIRRDGGFLTGSDRGEWGGAIWWQRDDGAVDTVSVAGRDSTDDYADNMQALFLHQDRIYAFVGLAHMEFSTGELLQLQPDDSGRWQARQVLDLGGQVRTFTWASRDTLLVLTSGELLAVAIDPSGVASRPLYSMPSVAFTYPSSVVRDRAGVIYIGMRSGVARLTPAPAGYEEDWMVPASCRYRVRVPASYTCRCIPTIP